MNYQREAVADILDELKPLLDLHWREIAHYQDIPLDPDYVFYETCQAVRLFTAREEGRLVGYGVFFVSRHKQRKSVVYAMQDALFLHPDYRRRAAGTHLIRFCEQELRRDGCHMIGQLVSRHHNFAPLLEREGYALSECLFEKRLDKE